MDTSKKNERKRRILNLIRNIAEDVGWEYLWLALKRINDQQMFHLSIPAGLVTFEPILKVLDNTTWELEHELYESEDAIESMEELEDILEDALKMDIFPER